MLLYYDDHIIVTTGTIEYDQVVKKIAEVKAVYVVGQFVIIHCPSILYTFCRDMHICILAEIDRPFNINYFGTNVYYSYNTVIRSKVAYEVKLLRDYKYSFVGFEDVILVCP